MPFRIRGQNDSSLLRAPHLRAQIGRPICRNLGLFQLSFESGPCKGLKCCLYRKTPQGGHTSAFCQTNSQVSSVVLSPSVYSSLSSMSLKDHSGAWESRLHS